MGDKGNLEEQANKSAVVGEPGVADEVQIALREKVAKLVRDHSREKARLISTKSVSALVPDAGNIQPFLVGMIISGHYRDIRLILAADDSGFLYSEQYLAREAAEKLLFVEEVKSQVAERVRQDSSKKKRITSASSLGIVIPGAEPDKIDSLLASFRDDERYKDIRVVANSRGMRYLYSEETMTGTFAEVQARSEANDPVATIAATVRDESRIYPRPTNLQTFAAPIFNINPDSLENYAAEVVRRPEYNDIKSLKASTGALYLYSTTYLNQDWVRATIEWEEVGKYLNP